MDQKTLGRWLKIIFAGAGVCGLVVYGGIVPGWGASLVEQYPEFADRYWPWLIFLWGTAIPCYWALVLGWRMARNIGQDRSFCPENARLTAWISRLAAADAAYFFAGNVALLLLEMSHPGVLLLSLLAVFVGAAVSAAAACLSHLVRKAAALQEQSDLTI